ncbi:hypothetical protein K1T71_005210 [Dendrolimus kikuchii]|uniref:Uncharacterized protein n=1 Tax=Dendrolimus kikuchii TaxID=765133 RepID=A0ACC1D6F5_9NEOP|nr:hypothetical protein K1T71_005210 [Dendrolimus kikuchii]
MVGYLLVWMATNPSLKYAAITTLNCVPESLASFQPCGALQDTAFHTLVECAAWGPQRALLENVVGPVSSLRSMVEAMLQGQQSWLAVSSFCESVMSQKEAAERAREEDAYADPIRRRRTGGRRRRYAHLLLP